MQAARYGNVAVVFHWLIALAIIGLLIVGKVMTGMAPDEPLRFVLTQWHKTFGILVLLLSVLRLLWRLGHAAPAHPAGAPGWEKLAASATHGLMYLLMFAIPVSGWILVSASPLGIDTLLFNRIEWPHIAWFANHADKADIAERFEEVHELAANLLIVLLLMHVGAALKHHLIDKDDVLTRMRPRWSEGDFRRTVGGFFLAAVAIAVAMGFYSQGAGRVPPLVAGSSQVQFVAMVASEETRGQFPATEVTANWNADDPSSGDIAAVVQTAGVATGNFQVDGSLPDPDWFDVENHPEARFQSTSITPAEGGTYDVEGELTIKGVTQPVQFSMSVAPAPVTGDADADPTTSVASGQFVVNRLDFGLGADSQPNEDSVAFDVTIAFSFELTAASPAN